MIPWQQFKIVCRMATEAVIRYLGILSTIPISNKKFEFFEKKLDF